MSSKSDSSTSSSDDDDWSCFFEAAVSVEQVAAEHVKIAKKGQQRLEKLTAAQIKSAPHLPCTPGDGAAKVAAQVAASTGPHAYGEMKAGSWRDAIEPVQQLTLTEKKIGANLDAILESRLQFKKPKEPKSSKKKDKHKASQSDCTGVGSGVGSSSADEEHTEQDPKYISHGFGIRLFKRTKAGLPVLERTATTQGLLRIVAPTPTTRNPGTHAAQNGDQHAPAKTPLLALPSLLLPAEAYWAAAAGPRMKPADLLEAAARAKRARLEAVDAAWATATGYEASPGHPSECGLKGSGGGSEGLRDKEPRSAAKAAKKAERRAQRAREDALAVMAVDGGQLQREAQAAAEAAAARAGLVMIQPVSVPAGEPGAGAGEGEGGNKGGVQEKASASCKRKDGKDGKGSKKVQAPKLVPAQGLVAEAKPWVSYETRTAVLLGIKT